MSNNERNPLTDSRAHRFRLVRDEDETGISGTGVVAEGVQFSNGWCAMSWLTPMHSVAVYPNIRQLEAIHGHNGRTRVEWVDGEGDEYVMERNLSRVFQLNEELEVTRKCLLQTERELRQTFEGISRSLERVATAAEGTGRLVGKDRSDP